ncbi:MAG: BREX-1 system adenine-specific DNA-methyltransferase PglX, partial [Chromatiaceae bacterium]|nr:BREX-1 system adenine-specific DNA-methyltransferase PglX [Candidatus Thioaporhodococcus sediminis]
YFDYIDSLDGRLGGSWKRGVDVWGKDGIAISQMGSLPISRYSRTAFDSNVCALIPCDCTHVLPIITFCSSRSFIQELRKIDQKLNITNATLAKVPFDLDHWTQVATEKYPNGLPKPYTDDPTQWIFHGHPCGSVIWDEERKWTAHGPLRTDETVLQVAVARLLGYRWPAELEPRMNTDEHGSETENIRVHPCPSVAENTMDLADEQRAWVARCESLLAQVDDDGILCIPPVRGEASAADSLLKLLAAAYGEAWCNETLSALLRGVDHGGKTLESWLRDKFFVQHCRLFQQRPFIWHLWDGLRDGFAALVNYHRFDRQNLERLIYTYLGDWIRTQERAAAEGRQGADERLAAAKALKTKLEAILEGEAPLDIFVRWKPIERQPIGWEPDLNDGVRLNIRPFMLAGDVGRKGAGVLRDKPNIKWEKDRGKDVESAPWFPVFKGERINDHHLTLAEKRAARATTASSV